MFTVRLSRFSFDIINKLIGALVITKVAILKIICICLLMTLYSAQEAILNTAIVTLLCTGTGSLTQTSLGSMSPLTISNTLFKVALSSRKHSSHRSSGPFNSVWSYQVLLLGCNNIPANNSFSN